ncbi:MAG: hypothetical protein ACYC6Y_19470, partial [Thermoguttaceae bacterium]
AYLQDRDEIDWIWAVLNDVDVPVPGELSHPWDTPSKTGDFVMVEQAAEVLAGDKQVVRFRQRDDFGADTAGFHFKQLLVDGQVAWEEDVAGGELQWERMEVDVSRLVQGKSRVRLALRLIDKRGVSNFGVRWRVGELAADGLRLGAGLDEQAGWQVSRQGAFESGFAADPKAGQRRFHIPFISMPAGTLSDYRKRHGEPATPEAMANLVRVSLEACRQGKCDGVVTYCLDKSPTSKTFPLVAEAFGEFRKDKAP